MKTIRILFLATFSFFISIEGYSENSGGKDPGEVYKNFMIALIHADSEKVKELCLPHDELNLLYSGLGVPQQYREQAINEIRNTHYRVLKVGETHSFAGGRIIEMTKELKEKDWIYIVSEQDPLPHKLKMTSSGPKVDPGEIIFLMKRR